MEEQKDKKQRENTSKHLLQATRQGRLFMVNYLLDTKGINVNQTDKDGQTPLINACLLDDNMAATRRKLIRLFLTKNADVNIVDKSGRNVLMWACNLGKIDVVKIVFGRSLMDLDFSCTDGAGNTALHYVSSTGRYTLTTMLVEAMKRFGVSLDVRNNDGMTPLLEATKNGHDMCAKVILENGASPDIVDPQTLMNVKELAEKGKLSSLVEEISIRNPRTPSRCAFARQPDDDDMRSAMGSRTASVSPSESSQALVNQSGAVGNRTKETRTPLLRGQKRKEEVKKSEKNTSENAHAGNIGALLDLKSESLLLTSSVVPPRTSSPRSISECSMPLSPLLRETKPAYRKARAKRPSNPYDLRDLRSVLSLYGEQQAPTFRRGFATPVMSTNEFQEYLETVKPQPIHRPSLTCSSTSSIGLSPLLQQRRRSVLLKECNGGNDRRHTICHNIGLFPKFTEERTFVRNLSDSCLLPDTISNSSSRRKSLIPSQVHGQEN